MCEVGTESEVIEFVVPGRPIPWSRARRVGNRYFVAPKTAKAKKQMRSVAEAEVPTEMMQSGKPFSLQCTFAYQKPKTSKLQKPTMKPDLDNLIKLIKDALNNVVWNDDSQVVHVTGVKIWDDCSYTKIRICELS